MKTACPIKRYLKPVLVIALLMALVGTVTACQDVYPSSSAPQPQPAPVPATGSTVITTRDAALLAVYQRLLDQAISYQAKTYLADFYATCDNWSAESEYFKDGSGVWYVTVDMTGNHDWKYRPYWQQASWFVFRDGKVIPANRFQVNALRIEADLQALSPETGPGPAESGS